MLGYCMLCGLLKPIRPGRSTTFERRVDYYPVQHDGPDDKPCDGHKKAIK